MAFVIHDGMFELGYREALETNLNITNAASNGTILMYDERVKGNTGRETLWAGTVDVTDRDVTSTGIKPVSTMGQLEHINIKVPFRTDTKTIKIEDIVRSGYTERQYSRLIGAAYAEGEMHYKMKAIVASLKAATTQAGADNNRAATAVNTKTLTALNASFGDKSGYIRSYLMHSMSSHGLIDAAIDAKVVGESGLVVYGASPGTLNKQVIVSDIDGLYVDPTEWIFALTAAAVELKNNSQPTSIISANVGTGENHMLEWSAEGTFNMKLKGSSYSGTANATLGDLGSPANWTKIATSHKAMGASMSTVN